jgi:hypothetical protein
MAARNFENQRYSLEKKVVDLFASVTFGASGAPTLNASKSKGVKSISRTSAGLYVITLQDQYNQLLTVRCTNVSSSAPAAPSMYVKAEAVNNATPTLTVVMNSAGTATDPGSGEEARLHIVLKNSSL